MIHVKKILRYRNIVFSAFLVLIILLSVAGVAARRAEFNRIREGEILPFDEQYPGFDLPRKIAVIYDNNHSLLINTALNVFTSTGIIYKNVHLLPLQNWNDLRLSMLDDKYWIKLYFINGNLDGVLLGGDIIEWKEIANAIDKPTSFHIFGSGSTDQLRALVPVNETKIRIEGSPVLGAEQSYFYYLWEIGEILAADPGLGYQRVAEDFRILGVKYFADNINSILNGIMDPRKMVNPLGEEDLVAKQRVWDEKMENWSDAYQYMPDQSIKRFDNDSIPVPETRVRIFNEDETDDEAEFKISDIPLFSGIEGPTAAVIDAILSVLIKFGGSALGLDPDTAIDICNTIKDIALMFTSSDEGEGDVKGTIKKLIKLITDNAPIPEKIKPFLPLVVDALYLIRGDATDITDFAGSVIETIFTVIGDISNSTVITTMIKVLKGTLLNGVELAELMIEEKEKAAEEGKKLNILNVIVGFAINKILNASTYAWWSDVLNGTDSPILKEIGKIMGFLSPLIKAFTTGDFDDLMEIIPGFVEYLFEKMTNQNLTSKEESAIATVSEFYRTAMGFFDAFTLPGKALEYWTTASDLDPLKANQKMFLKVINAAKPMLEVTVFANASSFSEDMISIVANASKGQLTDRNQLKQLISASMSNNLFPTDSQEAKTLIEALSWLGAICVPSMAKPLASDIKDVSKQFLGITTEVNTTVSDTKEKVFFLVLETIFGIIALGKSNTAAQLLLIDDASKLTEEGFGENNTLELKEIQWEIVNIGKNALTGLFAIWIDGLNTTTTIKTVLKQGIQVFADGIVIIAQVLISAEGNSITSFLRAAAMQAGALLFNYLGIDGIATMQIIQSLFTGLIGDNILGGEAAFNATQTMEQLQDLVVDTLKEKLNITSTTVLNLAKNGIKYLFMIKELITGGIDFIFKEFKTLLASFLADLISEFTGKIADKISEKPLLSLGGDIPLPGGDVIGIKLSFNLSIGLNIFWDNEAFRTWIEDLIFTGINDFKLDIPEFFKKIITFISFAPVFSASLTASTVSSGGGGVFGAVLAPLGVDLEVWGSIGFSIQLFAFSSGGFEPEGFMKILEWHFSIGFKVSKTVTIIEIILYCTGAGASVAGTVNKAMSVIGLDLVTLTIWLSAAFEIYQKAAHNGEPAQGSLTLTLGIGAFITIGLDLKIVAVVFKIGLDIYLIFKQDLTPGNIGPFTITLDIVLWAKLVLTFFCWDFEIGFEYRPPGFPLSLLPPPDSPDLKKDALGYDSDNDGLSDAQENESTSLDPYNPDTDGDGLGDKYELKVSKTDPGKYDTDGDGLSDFIEWYGVHSPPKADPNMYDTDMDGLSDGEEVLLYGTDPNSRDTDSDGLTDFYEVTTDWNLSGCTPSVTAVKIGDKIYNNRTDPLNPDTDSDGLLDGQEGAFGPWWGDPNNYGGSNLTDPLLLFNDGYTHPLDNDTDDDSFYQYYDGSIAGTSKSRIFARDMRDGVEIKGIAATLFEDGEPVSKVFLTNPCNPDSDGDTGQGREVKAGSFLNSDGYELSLEPYASDPLDSDTDDDGLIDGLEGTLLPERNYTTNFYNPDTDGDDLPDGLEIALGTDPSNMDTDNDLVSDGDEFFIYCTNPFLPDTDFDGVKDYWELFKSHSSPHSGDTDGDGIRDFNEIFIYGTDPVDEDSDNDDITDRDELIEYGTDPMNPDSDGDGLRDGPEIFKYETDPNNIDSDFDSILSPDENGDPTFLWTDFDELQYGTNPRSIDSDNDSLFDTWELYLALGDIPNFVNIPLNPLDNDTDDDGLIDGKELVVGEVEILVFPFVGYQTVYPLLTSPVDPDSDDDGLGDKFEVDNNLRPDLIDTDNDTLSDWDEIYLHDTDPRKNDTDGDGLSDMLEVTKFNTSAGIGSGISSYNPRYLTNALDPDSDGDGWPDGLEITATDGDSRYDPYDSDTNNNGILDGYERDFDHDLISDGDEYYTYNSYGTEHGGFLDYRNPDSDFDGLMDGDEILVYGTLPYSADTDLDGYSDPLELWIGTDPLIFTSEEEFLTAVRRLTSPLQMKSPEHNNTYTAGPISFEMLNLTTLDRNGVYFQWRKITESETTTPTTTPANTTTTPETTPATTPATTTTTTPETNETNAGWSDNIYLKYQGYSRWTHSAISFKEGEYELRIFGNATGYSYPTAPDRVIGSVLLENSVRFHVVKTEIDLGPIIAGGFAAVVLIASAAFIAFWIMKRRRALV